MRRILPVVGVVFAWFFGTAGACGDPPVGTPATCEEQLEGDASCRNFEGASPEQCPGEDDLLVLCWDGLSPPCSACVDSPVTSPNPGEKIFCCPSVVESGACPQC